MSGSGKECGACRRVDDPAPGMTEMNGLKARECRVEIRGQTLKAFGPMQQRRIASAPLVVDRVEAAPEYAIVIGFAKIVKLIAAVGDAMRPSPADLRQLCIGQGRGHQRIVEDRNDRLTQPPEKRHRRV